jgi:hypothetical protein
VGDCEQLDVKDKVIIDIGAFIGNLSRSMQAWLTSQVRYISRMSVPLQR